MDCFKELFQLIHVNSVEFQSEDIMCYNESVQTLPIVVCISLSGIFFYF